MNVKLQSDVPKLDRTKTAEQPSTFFLKLLNEIKKTRAANVLEETLRKIPYKRRLRSRAAGPLWRFSLLWGKKMRPIDLTFVFRPWVSSASAQQQNGNICKACNWCLCLESCSPGHVHITSWYETRQNEAIIGFHSGPTLSALRKVTKIMDDPSFRGDNFTANPAVCSQPLHNQTQLWSPEPFRQL